MQVLLEFSVKKNYPTALSVYLGALAVRVNTLNIETDELEAALMALGCQLDDGV